MKKIENTQCLDSELGKIVKGIRKGMGKRLKKGREAILFEFVVESDGRIVEVSATLLKNKNEFLREIGIKPISQLRYIG
ncbi:MAG: hypothetical protein OH354_04160 [Candidatus Parvarchaeota archaeon]|nr:hypothetical protein [Candidatus Jingweiarchaeum tengchongense]MCW1300464.1 hypothetical protein [Candidatus Jingweiarchaeum tengchongense]MCW1304946.1 hypothetical protein [Candidatus Jingweiarchaeum tengchongense]MCW1305494.1 hypothetical protein [Candidatus Jingweiarchaeum tengchongense]MCW1309982.1 hypothetical protein [Candidatus Jingweiarchaeum tengchongense]